MFIRSREDKKIEWVAISEFLLVIEIIRDFIEQIKVVKEIILSFKENKITIKDDRITENIVLDNNSEPGIRIIEGNGSFYKKFKQVA